MHFVFPLIILVVVSTTSAHQILTSPMVTNWGAWGAWERCPTGQYVTGFQLKVESWLGPLVDDSALNGIRFFCGSRNAGVTARHITSSVGNFGDWKSSFACNGNGYAIGFKLRALEAGEANVDETAGQNLRLLCHGSSTGYIEGDGESWGEWTAPRICSENEYICGIRTQVQPSQGVFSDDTAFNNLSVECCDLP